MANTGEIGMLYYALGIDSSRSVKDAAKWLLAAFAAIFAVLTAGLQFPVFIETTTFGQSFAIFVCSCITFIMVLLVIFHAAKVLTDPGISLEDLLNGETATKVHEINNGEHKHFGKGISVGSLSADDLLLRLKSIKGLTYQQTESPTKIRDALRSARREAPSTAAELTRREMTAEADMFLLLGVANKLHNAQIFSNLMKKVRLASIVVAIAIVCVIWSSAQTDPPRVLVSQPINTHLFLLDETDRVALGLGKSCSTKNLKAVIVGGTLDEPLVTTTPTAHCSAAKFVVTPNIGVSVPAPE